MFYGTHIYLVQNVSEIAGITIRRPITGNDYEVVNVVLVSKQKLTGIHVINIHM